MTAKNTRGAPAKEDRDDVIDQSIVIKVSKKQKELILEAAGRTPLARWARDHLVPLAEKEIAEAEAK